MKTLRFGIEIEVVGLGREAIALAIHKVVGGRIPGNSRATVIAPDRRTWKVVADGSLSNFLHSGEIVSPILTYGDLEVLQQICREVHDAGGRTDASCGIHIHVDGARLDAKGLANLAKMINKQEALLEAALGVTEARRARYCRPVDPGFIARLEARRPATMAEVSEAWYGRAGATPTRYDATRYHGLNLNSLFFRSTVEFRYFNGSLHAGKVKAYVQLVLAIVAKALAAKSTASKKRVFNPASAKYDFRVFLLGLGLIGPEFKTLRHHLLDHLGGSAAWKNGRPAPAVEASVAEASAPVGA